MVANLILKQDKYYCSECRIVQPHIIPRCVFCGAIFSNYEEELIEKIKKEEQFENEVDISV